MPWSHWFGLIILVLVLLAAWKESKQRPPR